MTKDTSGLLVRKKGDPQTPHMEFSGRISWWQKMVVGAAGNVGARLWFLQNHVSTRYLPAKDVEQLNSLITRANKLSQELFLLGKEIAKFNKEKKLRKMDNCDL